MDRVRAPLILLLALLLVIGGCTDPLPPTSIASFEASATTVDRGDPVTLSWQVDNPGSATDVPSCSITRRAENEPAGEPFEVACTGTLTENPPAPSTAGHVRYQLSAVKRPLDTVDPYLVSVITISLTSAPAVTGVSIDPSDASLPVGDTLQLTATVTAIGGASEAVTWSSSDEGVVNVNASGLVTAVAVGSATITATSDFDNSRSDSVNLSVRATTYAISAGGGNSDIAWAVSALDDGSAIVAGSFQRTAAFGGTTLTSAGGDDIFVARIEPNGTWAWATRAGATGQDRAYGASALGDGSAIVTGYFNGAATFGATTLTSAGFDDVFVARINANGTWAWATRAGGTGFEQGRGVSALADGSAIITGFFGGTAAFGSTTLTSAGEIDVFVAKIDALGA